VDSAGAARIGAAFEAMLIEPMLGSFGEASAFGAYGAGLLADEIARRDTRGFGALVARALEPVDGRS
jgi:hypothetical protein